MQKRSAVYITKKEKNAFYKKNICDKIKCMLDTLFFSLNAVLPLISLVVIGYILRQKNVFTDEFLKIANKFCFRFCFFSTMFTSIYNISGFDKAYKDLALFAICSIFALMAAGILYAVIFIKDNRQKGVMAQAFYRSNYAIIGIPLVTNLFGENGTASAAIVLACTIPIYNIAAVILLSVWVNDGASKQSPLKILKKIAQNPLLQGIFAGFICLLIRPYLHGWTLKDGEVKFIYRTIENLAKITTPLALIILGGQFTFSSAAHLLPQITAGVLSRLVFSPLLGLAAAHALFPAFSAQEYAALIPLFGSPVAVASAIMAREMKNDGELATQILVWTTLFSGITIFIIIVVLRTLNWL